MARVIIEFESDEDAQRFADRFDGWMYYDVGYGDWSSVGATITDDSPVQPTPPPTEAERRKAIREGKQAASRNHLQEYVDRMTGIEKGSMF